MTLTDAYYFTLSKVKELRESGVEVTIIDYPKIQEHVDKYQPPKHLESKLWRTINFKLNTPSKVSKVFEAAQYLFLCGIYFDNGGMGSSRDWQLDWSFDYTPGDEQWELKQSHAELEECFKQ